MPTETFDVVIVGSGYGGSIPAARLAQAGMSVLVLERGARLAQRDLQQSDDPKYLQKIVDLVIASDNVAFRTGKLVGGASIPMDGAHFRMPQKSFEAKETGGRRYWPALYSRAQLDPYYARVEAMLSVRQVAWTEVSRAGGLFAKMLGAAGASCDRARMNYRDCLQCGFCAQGCVYDKKQSMLRTYIPLAESAGAKIRPGCDVQRLEPSGTGYLVHFLEQGKAEQVIGRRVIVAGGGVHSPALLLRSAAKLTKLSSHVGKHFNNNGEHPYVGILPPDHPDIGKYHCYKGMDNAGLMSFHWFDSEGLTLHPGGGLEPSLFAAALASANHPVLPKRSWGLAYKRFVESVYPNRVIAFSSLGLADGFREVTASGNNVDVKPVDRTGFDAYLDRLEHVIDDVAKKSGVTLFPAVPRRLAGMTSAHLLSACRMAESAKDGVVDPDGQVFGHDNLWLCDASAVPYALGVNPALTISAIAERTAEKIIAKG